MKSNLPIEIIHQIALYLTRNDLITASFSNKYWYNSIQSLIWKSVKFTINEWDSLKMLFKKPFIDYKQYIYHLFLLDYPQIEYQRPVRFNIKLLQGCINITS